MVIRVTLDAGDEVTGDLSCLRYDSSHDAYWATVGGVEVDICRIRKVAGAGFDRECGGMNLYRFLGELLIDGGISLKDTSPVKDTSLSLAEVERLHIMAVLREFGGDKSKAERRLGISHATMYRKLSEYGLDKKYGK